MTHCDTCPVREYCDFDRALGRAHWCDPASVAGRLHFDHAVRDPEPEPEEENVLRCKVCGDVLTGQQLVNCGKPRCVRTWRNYRRNPTYYAASLGGLD